MSAAAVGGAVRGRTVKGRASEGLLKRLAAQGSSLSICYPAPPPPPPLTADTDDLLTRMVIVGIVMSFRRLTLEALHAVLSRRTPFLISAIERFHENPPAEHPEVAGAGGGVL